jgi:hypothetical protein
MKKKFLKSYGIYLNGREEGAAAFRMLEREIQSLSDDDRLFFNFSEVVVLAPSWCDEFFGEAVIHYPGRIVIDQTIHLGLKKSFEVVEQARGITFTYGLEEDCIDTEKH